MHYNKKIVISIHNNFHTPESLQVSCRQCKLFRSNCSDKTLNLAQYRSVVRPLGEPLSLKSSAHNFCFSELALQIIKIKWLVDCLSNIRQHGVLLPSTRRRHSMINAVSQLANQFYYHGDRLTPFCCAS